MKPVRDDHGNRYLLLKRSERASLVRDPETGDECYVQNDRLEFVAESGLETAAATIDDPVRTLLTNVHDEKTLGLLVELENRGALGVRTLLDAYNLCESDLHGRLTVLSSAGLLAEIDVAGERGYRLTETCELALEAIRTDETAENDENEEPPLE
ncbi:DUF7346 family protein [Natronobacterium gregoryi]|uniref:Uncharacterized protein n=2 Tax=Natronobacterium gregoryi TaxID=44930 RepID=L0AFH8_NATGS|nr:hypothetical protein [Natronobacterium gregoryi]AFZ71815.1 hypothetical protein Natgr_0565 [Natronobacterium gregoryi SP2]ELY72954.1 hypothetical protein C490_02206 [Natronobacterium gregoryi SP2]PLK21004.1 hypothetical protein CYV19_06105 [Natronobacterium gregoryi SP2]SFI87201.1 hypothetical protein SAMN05443661_1086 [Natronobacterium gregoryi]